MADMPGELKSVVDGSEDPTRPVTGASGDSDASTGNTAAPQPQTGEFSHQNSEANKDGIVQPAKDKIKAVLQEKREDGADRLAVLGSAIEEIAPKLEKDMPGLASCARNAGSWINDAASDLREQRFEVLLQSANDYARKNPAAAFGLAAMSGFVLSRFLKSGSKSPPDKTAS